MAQGVSAPVGFCGLCRLVHGYQYVCLSAEEPLYGYLKEKQSGIMGSDVKWNFTKFLVNKKGDVVKR